MLLSYTLYAGQCGVRLSMKRLIVPLLTRRRSGRGFVCHQYLPLPDHHARKFWLAGFSPIAGALLCFPQHGLQLVQTDLHVFDTKHRFTMRAACHTRDCTFRYKAPASSSQIASFSGRKGRPLLNRSLGLECYLFGMVPSRGSFCSAQLIESLLNPRQLIFKGLHVLFECCPLVLLR